MSTLRTVKPPPPLEAWRPLLKDAVTEVFSMMVGVEISSTDQAILPAAREVSGLIGLAGDLCGVLSLQCSTVCASTIASRMLHVAESEAANHMNDAIGEICNMVAGSFKARLPGLEDKCMLSVPTVITGANYQIYPVAAGEGIDLTFKFENEFVSICLEIRS